MSPTDRRALALYTRYKTQTREYREIAEGLALSVGELNQRMHPIYHARRVARLRARRG